VIYEKARAISVDIEDADGLPPAQLFAKLADELANKIEDERLYRVSGTLMVSLEPRAL